MQRRWSQGELARRLDIHRSYISRIESGAIQLPELETRRRFHDVFGTEEADLEAYGIVPRYDEWGRVIPGDARASGGRVAVSLGETPDDLPSRDVTADLPDERDNAPLTAEEELFLSRAMFHGFDELEPADLREVIQIIRRRQER